jgi:hypothetical protein
MVFLLHSTGGDEVSGPADETRGKAEPDGCGQVEYAINAARQEHPSTWRLNVSSIPAYLDRAGTVRAIKRADLTIARARSSCAGPAAPTPMLPPSIYAGPTVRAANVTPGSKCFPSGNSDGINVVSFGPLPPDVVAVTCTYTDRGDIWQSDVMLNDREGLFTLTPRSPSCESSFDLQSVVTHERGHSFGLAHVPASPHTDAVTMSSSMARCDDSGRTLGAGDVAGLSRLY